MSGIGENSIDELFEAARMGENREALNELLARLAPWMFRTCRRLMGNEDDARDLLQTVFCTAIDKISSLHAASNFRGWLYRVAVNSAMSAHRAAARRARTMAAVSREEACKPFNRGVENAFASRARRAAVRKAIDQLSEKRRDVVVLFYTGFSTAEIGEILEVAPEAVRNRLFEGRKHLRKILPQSLAESLDAPLSAADELTGDSK